MKNKLLNKFLEKKDILLSKKKCIKMVKLICQIFLNKVCKLKKLIKIKINKNKNSSRAKANWGKS
jgi:hypothetical protein